MRRHRLGISYALAAVLALAVTAVAAGIAIYGYSLAMGSAAAGALKEGELQIRKAAERVSLVYWLGGRLALKNYGEVPVTIRYIFTDRGLYSQPTTINPGEIKVFNNIPSSDKLGIVTEHNVLILRDRGRASAGGGSSEPQARISITRYSICETGTAGNYKVYVSIRNTGTVTVSAINFIYIGSSGATSIDARNWSLSPGQEVKDYEILFSRINWGDGVYVRVVGFSAAGGSQVSDAVWIPFDNVPKC